MIVVNTEGICFHTITVIKNCHCNSVGSHDDIIGISHHDCNCKGFVRFSYYITINGEVKTDILVEKRGRWDDELLVGQQKKVASIYNSEQSNISRDDTTKHV